MTSNRRKFIKQSLAASTVFTTFPILSSSFKKASFRTALVGSGWWGGNILRYAMASGACKIVSLCDVDQKHLEMTKDEVQKLSGDRPKLYEDYRELIKKEKPEIVIVATPDHWHALPAIAAIESGAHVYLEKPVGHTIGEGQAILKAARANDRVVQVGLHRHVSPHNKSGIEFLKEGKAGKIGAIRAFVHYGARDWKSSSDQEIPKGLNWDFWCGPAPYRPYNPKIHPKGFRHFLDYANGQVGDWGVHWFDQVLWWAEEDYPKRVYSQSARYLRDDNTDAPDSQVAVYDFENFSLTWEHRLFAGNSAEKSNIGCYFYGEKGTFHMGWLDGWTFYPSGKNESVIHEDPKLEEPDKQNIAPLWNDFLESIRNKRRAICDIQVGHRASNLSLLAMISAKVNRSIEWDGEQERVLNDPEAQKLLRRPYRQPWIYPE